jgi:hypothetical protein
MTWKTIRPQQPHRPRLDFILLPRYRFAPLCNSGLPDPGAPHGPRSRPEDEQSDRAKAEQSFQNENEVLEIDGLQP